MADNRPRPCTRCVAEVEEGERAGVILEWLPCYVCGEPACEEHGHEYRRGFAHEDCHNNDMSGYQPGGF